MDFCQIFGMSSPLRKPKAPIEYFLVTVLSHYCTCGQVVRVPDVT